MGYLSLACLAFTVAWLVVSWKVAWQRWRPRLGQQSLLHMAHTLLHDVWGCIITSAGVLFLLHGALTISKLLHVWLIQVAWHIGVVFWFSADTSYTLHTIVLCVSKLITQYIIYIHPLVIIYIYIYITSGLCHCLSVVQSAQCMCPSSCSSSIIS